jgi:hypothetical protein
VYHTDKRGILIYLYVVHRLSIRAQTLLLTSVQKKSARVEIHAKVSRHRVVNCLDHGLKFRQDMIEGSAVTDLVSIVSSKSSSATA